MIPSQQPGVSDPLGTRLILLDQAQHCVDNLLRVTGVSPDRFVRRPASMRLLAELTAALGEEQPEETHRARCPRGSSRGTGAAALQALGRRQGAYHDPFPKGRMASFPPRTPTRPPPSRGPRRESVPLRCLWRLTAVPDVLLPTFRSPAWGCRSKRLQRDPRRRQRPAGDAWRARWGFQPPITGGQRESPWSPQLFTGGRWCSG